MDDIGPTYRRPGLVCTDRWFDVPLDHDRPEGESIRLFARELVAPGREQDDLPWLLFLQGGPGGKAPRPALPGAWLERLLRDFRVLLLDQRGTGRSTPANRYTLAGRDSAAQATYLACLRADSIVRDAELIRSRLLGDRPWSLLGQSFGGFCALTYLSFHPESLRQVMIAGGLAPLTAHPDDIYRRLYPRVLARNRDYFSIFPDDRGLLLRIRRHLEQEEVRLPGGDRLSWRRLQTLGFGLGVQSRFEELHYVFEEAFCAGPGGETFTDTFLREVDSQVSFATGPLYALLQEPAYCQGFAAAWSAQRVRSEFEVFDDAVQPSLTGEMIYPWMFEEDPALAPLRAAAELLAAKQDWPRLYDPAALAANCVPCAAVVYFDDMYVDRELSLETAAAVRGLRVWVTNEFLHDGLRQDVRVVERLLAMVRGEA